MKLIFTWLIILCLSANVMSGGVADYFKNVGTYLGFNQPENNDLQEEFQQQIPYEVSVPDEKFISEAIKLTGVALSELDTCQHRVVLKLQMDCRLMNDELISKMAVALLNCQSYVEGRRIYPCTDQMSIKGCTTDMDADTWNSYHLMSNRVRAVCYSIRQSQFRGLTEQTINKLLDAARNQLTTLGKIAVDQENIQNLAQDTLNTVGKGHKEIVDQQKDLQKAQLYGQLAIEDNIKRLADEKTLIIESQRQLAFMTKNMQEKLNKASQQLEDQNKESDSNHKELLLDLVAIQEKAQIIFQRIEDSSELLIKQSQLAREQYEATLNQLSEVNATVHALVSLVGGTKQALEERLEWITTSLGGTDVVVERVYLILWHSAFLLVVMVVCAFIGARSSTRAVVVTLVPTNLAMAMNGYEYAMDPLMLAASLGSYIAVQMIFVLILSITRNDKTVQAIKNIFTPIQNKSSAQTRTVTPEHSTNGDFDMNSVNDHISPLSSLRGRFKSSQDSDKDNYEEFSSPTPPLSRNGQYLNRSRSRTPLTINISAKSSCKASTRVGTPCKLSSMPGRDFCYRHQSGDSVMG